MKALVIKDLAMMKKPLLFTAFLCLVIGSYGISENYLQIIPAMCAMMPLMISSISFGYDVQSHFEQYAFSMPIKKLDYVLSKYIYAMLFGLFGAAITGGVLCLRHEMQGQLILLIASFSLSIPLLLSAVQLPFVFKFGAEKGRLIMVLTYFLIFGSVNFLKEYFNQLVAWVSPLFKGPMSVLSIGILLISFTILYLSILLSTRIMKSKEY